MLHRMALSNQCLNTFLDFAMYHRLYPVPAESVKSLGTSGASTALRRYAHFYHLSVSIDCACNWGEINLNSLLSSMDELEREYSYVSLSECAWSDLKRSIIYQILLGALREMTDRPDKSVSDSVTSHRYTSEIEHLLKVYQHYHHDNVTDSLHTSFGQLRESFLNGVMDKDELNCDRVRRLLVEHPLEAFKLKVIQFLRLIEDKALPIPKTLVGEYDHPEVSQNYSHNTITTLTGASEDTRKRRRLDLLVNAAEKSAGSNERIPTEDLVSHNCVPTATSTGGGAIAAADSASHGAGVCFTHDKQDSDDSVTIVEIHQRNQKMLELFRTNYLRRFSTDVAPPDHFPFNTATSKLSVIDAVTKSYYPQYREMQRAIARGETSWPFTKEQADRHRAEARARAERERAHLERMKAAQYVCDTSDEEEQGKEQEEVEDPGTTQPSTARAHSVSPRAEASSIVCTNDSEKQSETYKEMVQRNLQMAKRRKERREMILSYKEGDSIDPFLPTAFATGKLSAIDAATVKYYPQFIEMQQKRLRGEPSWWSFLKEGEDKYIAEARDLAEFEKAEYASFMAARCNSDQEEEEEEMEVEGDDDEGDEERKTIDGEEGGG